MLCQYMKNDLKIIRKVNNSNNLSDILSWKSIYLNNDIYIINYDSFTCILKLAIYYDNFFNFCNLNVIDLSLETTIKKLEDKVKIIKTKSENIYDFLVDISQYLNYINEPHDNFSKEQLVLTKIKNNFIEQNNKFEWDPYKYLHIKNNYNFDINILKNNALQFYKDNPFDCQDLQITSEHIIDIIIKELQQLDNNDIFKLCVDNNIFEFDIIFSSFTNKELNKNLQDKKLEGIKMNIKLDYNLYPYFPPKISFKHKLDDNLDKIINKLSYFNSNNWNPTNTLLSMVLGIHKILNDHAIISLSINKDFESMESLIQNLICNNNINYLKVNKYENINLDYVKLTSEKNIEKQDNKYWKSGIGYGTNGRNTWNLQKYIKEKEVKTSHNIHLLNNLFNEINKNKNISEFKKYIINSNIFDIILNFIDQINLIEMDAQFKIYEKIFNIIFILDFTNWEKKPIYELEQIAKKLYNFFQDIEIFIKLNKNIEESKYNLYYKIIKYYKSIKDFTVEYKNKCNSGEYCEIMKQYQLKDFIFHKYYYSTLNNNDKPSKNCISKITKELSSFNSSLPMNYETSIYVTYDSNNFRNIKALIIGPQDTPYENGCYIFDIFIPNNYPDVPPKVNLQTTGNGTVRFNPNLYNCGKVCLSLLGTWSGKGGEEWNNSTSTLLQVLVSIQSLIFVETPYFNEPGYEKDMNTANGIKKNFEYNDSRRHDNIKWAIMNNIQNPDREFKDVINNHFKLKKNDIIKTINIWHSETNNKSRFNETKNNCIDLLDKL